MRVQSAVNCQRLDAAVLQLLGELNDDLVVAIPSQASLGSDGNVDRTHHLAGDLEHERHVAQHAGASALVGDLLHRAAKVEVYHIGVSLLRYPGSLDHGSHLTAINLYSRRALARVDDHLAQGAVDAANHGVGAHKLGIHHVGTLLAANLAERHVGHVLHGRQHHWLGT